MQVNYVLQNTPQQLALVPPQEVRAPAILAPHALPLPLTLLLVLGQTQALAVGVRCPTDGAKQLSQELPQARLRGGSGWLGV